MSDAANCICIHGYVSTCPLHGDPNNIRLGIRAANTSETSPLKTFVVVGEALPNASPPSWDQRPFPEPDPTITLSEHAAQLQAACVELRETAATLVYQRMHEEVSQEILMLPVPTAALETALDKKQTETITACAFAVCEGCKNGWLLSHGSHQTPQQGQWFPCKADAILALSPVKVAAALERTIAEARFESAHKMNRYWINEEDDEVVAYYKQLKAALDAAKAKENDAVR